MVEVKGEVFFEPIADTEFTSAVVVSKHGAWDVEYSAAAGAGDNLIDQGVDALGVSTNANITHAIPKWRYCSNDAPTVRFPYYYTVSELNRLLQNYRQNKTFPPQCDESLVKKLLLTAGVANKHVNGNWPGEVMRSTNSLFVTTSGGYHKTLSSTPTVPYTPTHTVFGFDNVAGYPEDLITFSVSPPDVANKILTVTSAVRVGTEKVLVAVSGATLTFDQLNALLTKKVAPGVFVENDSQNLRFLIDRNGRVVFSNRGRYDMGRFMSELSSPLLQHLESVGVMKKVQLEGLPEECVSEDSGCVKSSSNLLLTPLRILSTGFFALLNAVSWVSVQYTALLFSATTTNAESDDDTPKTYSCTKVKTYYIVQEEKVKQLQEADRIFQCGGKCPDVRFTMKRVPDTNLFFVSLNVGMAGTPNCQRVCTRSKPLVEKEKMENASAPQRYRRVPGVCLDEPVTGEESSRDMCGSGVNILPSLGLLCILTLVGNVLT